MNRRFYPVVATTLALLLASGNVSAQEAGPAVAASEPDAAAKQEAARRFEHAIKLYEEADYMLAQAEFERVYELVPDYRVLYNIGQVSIQLGQYARALRTLREYLRRGGEELPDDRAASVQGDINLLTARTAKLAFEVEPEGADVSINGSSVGQAPLTEPVIVDVGRRTIQVKLPGYVPQTETVTLAGGDERKLRFELAREGAADAAKPPPAPLVPVARPADRQATASRRYTWVGWTATGALTASAVVAGVMGASAAGKLKELRSEQSDRDELDEARDRAQTRLLVADILGAAAVATGAVTLYFQLSGPAKKDRAAPSVSLALTPRYVTLRLER